ncbi:MAG: TonB-dependent receptor [Acidobacteria bacterium]|nr:TonB-dependent receptor [Acidobacteriota bacterium]
MKGRVAAVASAVLVVVCVLAAVAPAWAAGGLRVNVVAPEKNRKEPAVGATVQLISAGGQAKVEMTDEKGVAEFAGVPPADNYTVIVDYLDFNQWKKAGIRVAEGAVTTVQVEMLGAIVEQVDVRTKVKVVELEQPQGETTLSAETFGDLPVQGRDYQNALSLAAGVQDSNSDGNPNVHGSRERDFRMEVDGVSNVDPLTGQRMSDVNPDAIEEIQIVTDGADASYGGAVGGFGKIVTKSGGNDFEGSFNLFLGHSMFNNDEQGSTRSESEFRDFRPSLYVSGPLIKDHLWYSLNHEYTNQKVPVHPIGGQGFVREAEQNEPLYKLTWQVNAKNRLQFQYSGDPWHVEPYFADWRYPISSNVKVDWESQVYSLKWTAPYSPTFFWESTIARSDVGFAYEPYEFNVRNSCIESGVYTGDFCYDTETLTFSGSFPEIYDDQRGRWTYKLDAEQFLSEALGGSHRIKAGFLVEVADFERKLDVLPNIDYTKVDVVKDPMDPDPIGQAAHILFRQTAEPAVSSMQAKGNYYAVYLSDNYEPLPNLNVTLGLRYTREELSADGWLTLDPGSERQDLRQTLNECLAQGFNPTACVVNLTARVMTSSIYDNPDNDGDGVPDYQGAFDCLNASNDQPCTLIWNAYSTGGSLRPRSADNFTIVNNNLAPRLSFAWDPRNDGKTRIAGSWARYYGDTFLDPFVSENGPDYTRKRIVLNESWDDLKRTTLSAYSIRQLDRNMRSSHNDEWTLSIEREIAPETSVLVRYINRRYIDQLQDIDVNHTGVAWNSVPANLQSKCDKIGKFADCYGDVILKSVKVPRPHWEMLDIPDGIPDLQVVSPMFNQVLKIGNYNQSDYQAYILELNRRFYQNWEFSASYTWSESLGQAEDYNQGLGNDATMVEDERGPLSTDQRHVLKGNGRMLLPWWGGFRIGGNFVYQSGLPYSILERRDIFDYPTNLLEGTVDAAGNPVTQTFPVQFLSSRTVYPTGHRNDHRNAPFWLFGLNFQKEMMFKSIKATFQLDIFNVLNNDVTWIDAIYRREVSNSKGTTNWIDTPVAQRLNGRQFQLMTKFNF